MTVGVGLMGAFEPRRFRQIVGMAERLGYSTVWVADEGLYRNVYALLAVAALSSTSIRLGTAVTNPYTRHPALTAAAIATIDELSGERAVLGLGAGGSALAALGMERDRPVDAVRDAVCIITGLTEGGRVNYRGRQWSFAGALNLVPIRRVPILIAGRGPRMLRLAGELADGVIIGGVATMEGIRRGLGHVMGGRQDSGRRDGFEVVSWLYTSIAGDRSPAAQAVSRLVAVSIINSRHSLADLGIELQDALRGVLDRHGWRRSEELISAVKALLTDDLIDAFSVTGPANHCAERVAGLGDLGVTHAGLLFFPPGGSSVEEQMERYAAAMAERRP
jgi:5,10-methylenetetrahydromethanopterin reductase